MQTPTQGTTPNMVAVGISKGPGTSTLCANPQGFMPVGAMPLWKVRDAQIDTTYIYAVPLLRNIDPRSTVSCLLAVSCLSGTGLLGLLWLLTF